MRGTGVASWAWAHAQAAPERPAIDGAEVRLSYGGLVRAVAALAGDLRARGFGRGDRLLVALPPSPAVAVAILAAQAAGGAAVPVDRELPAAAARSVAAQTGARFAVLGAVEAPRWAGVGALACAWVLPAAGARNAALGVERVARLAPDGAPTEGAAPLAAPAATGPGDEALILFTSGSTGVPRGVVQTHGNVAANTRSIVTYLGLGPQDRALLVLPLSYCYGLSVLQTHLAVGGSVYVEPGSMFPRAVAEALGREGCTGFAGVPLSFELLRRHVDVAAAPRPRLRYVTQAGGAMGPDTVRWARAAFAPAPLYVMYGQTEATARLAYLPPARAADKAGAIGVPIPGVELRVVGPDGRELPAGEVGELVARGENVAAGYLGAPEETAATFRPDGLHTGDLAYRDADGFFFVVGRAREMLKIGGHRVSPAQIEQALLEDPAVQDAAVVGVPDPLQGEAPVAFVVGRAGQAPSARELRARCRRALPAHCVPGLVCFLDALPRSAAGKVQRQRLREVALAAAADGAHAAARLRGTSTELPCPPSAATSSASIPNGRPRS